MVYMYGHNPKLDSTLRALRWLLSWHDHESSSLAKSCSIGEWGTRLHGTTHQRSFALLLLLPVASTINQIDIDYGRSVIRVVSVDSETMPGRVRDEVYYRMLVTTLPVGSREFSRIRSTIAGFDVPGSFEQAQTRAIRHIARETRSRSNTDPYRPYSCSPKGSERSTEDPTETRLPCPNVIHVIPSRYDTDRGREK